MRQTKVRFWHKATLRCIATPVTLLATTDIDGAAGSVGRTLLTH